MNFRNFVIMNKDNPNIEMPELRQPELSTIVSNSLEFKRNNHNSILDKV